MKKIKNRRKFLDDNDNYKSKEEEKMTGKVELIPKASKLYFMMVVVVFSNRKSDTGNREVTCVAFYTKCFFFHFYLIYLIL